MMILTIITILVLMHQGYTHPREYIVTEWPVVSTCRCCSCYFYFYYYFYSYF